MIDTEMKNYVDWNVKNVIRIIDRERYAYRVVLIYKDGSNRIRQHSGFRTKKEAEDARKITIAELVNRTYIVNTNVRMSDFLDCWLEQDIRQRVGSNNTYSSFKNVVCRHIDPILGKKKLIDIHAGDVQRLYQNRAEYSKSIAKQTKTVMNLSMNYAVSCRFLAVNPAEGIPLPKTVKSQPYHTRNIDTSHTLTMEQMQLLLESSKETPIHMQVCFNVLMGLRRQEINGVKYSDVDYINRTLSVERQLGKELNDHRLKPVG